MQNFWLGYGEVKTGKKIGEKYEKVFNYKNKVKDGGDYSSPPTHLDGYAGILRGDLMYLDFDHMEEALKVREIFIKEGINIPRIKTDRGYHFLFSYTPESKVKLGNKEYTKALTPLGFTVDIKWGKCSEVLKFNGNQRVIENESNYKLQDIGQATFRWLYPICKLSEKHYNKFLGLEDGDGRDNALFENSGCLQGYEKWTERQVVMFYKDIVNKYLLTDPYDLAGIERCAREIPEEMKKSMMKVKEKVEKRKLREVEDIIIERYNVRVVNGVTYAYDDVNHWQVITGNARWYREKVDELHAEDETVEQMSDRKEMLRGVEALGEIAPIMEEPKGNYIGFKNGVYSLDDKSFVPWSKDLFVSNAIPWNYNSNVEVNSVFEKFFDKITEGVNERKELLLEMIGYTFIPSNTMRKGFVLVGDGSNGKSTLLNFVGELWGEDNVSRISVGDFGGKDGTYPLIGSRVNISDDINGFSRTMEEIKKYISGDEFRVKEKYQVAVNFKPKGKLLIAANNLDFLDGAKQEAIKSRFIFIPFNATIRSTDEDYDPFLGEKLKNEEVIQYVINLALERAHRLLETKTFTIGEENAKLMSNVVVDSNNVLEYLLYLLDDACDDEKSLLHILTKCSAAEAREDYFMYCQRNGLKALKTRNFSKELRAFMPFLPDSGVIKFVEGKNKRVYIQYKELAGKTIVYNEVSCQFELQ